MPLFATSRSPRTQNNPSKFVNNDIYSSCSVFSVIPDPRTMTFNNGRMTGYTRDLRKMTESANFYKSGAQNMGASVTDRRVLFSSPAANQFGEL